MLPIQCKLARIALGWEIREVARSAGISPNTVVRLERGERLKPETVQRIRVVYEDGGVEFIDEGDGKGPGVRLRRPVG
jgi:transcriptional regulator with XRE-family HTH domain